MALEPPLRAQASRLQVFNEINSRKLKDELNIFAGLWRSRTFVYIIIVTIGLQVGPSCPSLRSKTPLTMSKAYSDGSSHYKNDEAVAAESRPAI